MILDKETGLLFEADDKESLFNLLEFIANDYPNELTSSIIEKATDFVNNNRNWNLNAKKYKKILLIYLDGGHFAQILELKELFFNYSYLLVTEKSPVTLPLKDEYDIKY